MLNDISKIKVNINQVPLNCNILGNKHRLIIVSFLQFNRRCATNNDSGYHHRYSEKVIVIPYINIHTHM